MRARVLAIVLLAAAGCGRSFAVRTPGRFVALDEPGEAFAYRAITADGVVIAVRSIEHEPRGSLRFWAEAIENRMRLGEGYAIEPPTGVRAANGVRGRRLRFGRDQGTHAYRYWIDLYVTDDWIHLVETGGRADRFDPHRAAIERALSSFRPE